MCDSYCTKVWKDIVFHIPKDLTIIVPSFMGSRVLKNERKEELMN